MITAHCLTKRFGATTAVDKLRFEVRPGVVTGFLGPHGSGKSTTIRMIMGLDVPTFGSALIGGKPFASFWLSRLSYHPPMHCSPTPLHREPTGRRGRPAHLRPRLRGRPACGC
jgi:ABC-type multidrug transport system ATPase subunit